MTHGRTGAAFVVMLLASGAAGLLAHNVTPEPIVELTFTPAGERLAVEAKLPVAALADANLPRASDGSFDQEQIGPALELVAQAFVTDLDPAQGDQRLPAPTIAAHLSPDQTQLIIEMAYAWRPGSAELTARLATFRAGSQRIRTVAHYVAGPDVTRTFSIIDAPMRVEFEPGPLQVVQHALSQGVDVLLSSGDFLLFAICVAVPLASRRPWLFTAAALLVAECAAALLSGFRVEAVSASTLYAIQAVAASAIAMAAILDCLDTRANWFRAVAIVFGIANGLSLGNVFHAESAFSGTHLAIGLLTFLVFIAFGQTWIVALLSSALDLVVRWGVPARLLGLGLAIFSAHSALHRFADRSASLAPSGSAVLDRWLVVISLAWGTAVLCVGIANALRSAGTPDRSMIAAREKLR